MVDELVGKWSIVIQVTTNERRREGGIERARRREREKKRERGIERERRREREEEREENREREKERERRREAKIPVCVKFCSLAPTEWCIKWSLSHTHTHT